MKVIDAHIHLDQYTEKEREELLHQAKLAGVTHVVAVSMNLHSAKITKQLYDQYKDMIIPAYGYHPEQPIPSLAEQRALITLIEQELNKGNRLVIGEVGLPYYTALEQKEQGRAFDTEPYVRLLEQYIKLAKQYDLPIVLHAVYEDAVKAIELLQTYEVSKAHFHWFKAESSTVKQMAELGYYISITPDVYYELEIQNIVAMYPLTQLMVETDGPWPFEGPFAGQATKSAMVVAVVEKIAELLQLPVEEVAEQIYQNTVRFYELDKVCQL